MKCPKCAGRRLVATNDQISFYRSWIKFDPSGDLLDVMDGKHLDDGDWWIVPDAPCSCDTCHHEGVAKDFAEGKDKTFIVDALDHFLFLELRSLANGCDAAAPEHVKALLTLRGRGDLAETVG